jgi:hypothetical protein
LTRELDRYQSDPIAYCGEVLDIKQIWRLQEELLIACLRAIKERKPIFMASGHSLGKDYISAGIALWFLQTFTPSQVVLTAPTLRQVKNVMFKEVCRHWENKKIDLGGKIFTEPRIEINPSWFLTGFTTDEAVRSEGGGGKFQGLHCENVCVIVTEAQELKDNVYDQIDAITTSQKILVIFIGNPTRAKGRFAKGLKDKKNNIVFNFSCLENPNYIQRKEVVPGLASYEWVEAMRQKWGETDPRWIGRVLGQVPDQALNQVFTEDVIAHGIKRFGFIAKHSYNRGVAWDPAGEGIDDHVFLSGSEGEPIDVFTKTLMTPTEGALKAVEMCKAILGSWIIVDCDGSGARDYQALKELPPEYLGKIQLIQFHGSGASTKFSTILSKGSEVKKQIYANMRTEAAFIAKDRILAGHASINPKDQEMIEDLQEDILIPDKPFLQIVPKEEIKEVIGRSPGRGDAYKMFQWACEQGYKENAYSDPVMPAYANTDRDLYRDAKGLPTHAITA